MHTDTQCVHSGSATHEYLEAFDSYFPNAEIEYYYYDQLESYYSDQPNDSSLWTVERYVDEVEQVRVALGLNKNNFYLYGSSWGGILCMEYALKYQENLNSSQTSLFSDATNETYQDLSIPSCEPWSNLVRLKKEKEVVGIYISSHPLDDFTHETRKKISKKITNCGRTKIKP